MPKTSQDRIKKAHKHLKQSKVFSFNDVLTWLSCSPRSGRTRLKQWGALASYNQNGRYYTLPSVPCFDKNGLWRYKTARFSKHGNLKKTTVHLIRASSAGLTGNEIGEIVGLSPSTFLHHFRDAPGINREKLGGVYVYFSDETSTAELQKQKRLEKLALAGQPLSDADAILILAALIKHHEICLEDIASLPEIKKAKLDRQAIRRFLEHHKLSKKNAATKP